MDLNRNRSAPVERLLATVNLIMAVLWVGGLGHSRYAPYALLANLLAACLPLIIARARRLHGAAAILRDLYPLLWLAAFWSLVDPLRRALHGVAHDEFIRSLEVSLFGLQPHAEWMPAMPFVWLSEPLHFCYFIYYVTIFGPILVLIAQQRRAELREAYFRLLLTYAVCFLAFALFPVDGPHHLEVPYVGPNANGIWYRIAHLFADNGGGLGAAFPSSHAAGAATIAVLGHLYFSRSVALLLTVQAFMVALATFYTQYHYAIDPVAGVCLALFLQRWVAPILLGHRSHKPQVLYPLKPAFSWVTSAHGTSI